MNQISPLVPAAETETSTTDLEIFDRRYKPADLFVPGAFDPVLAHIRHVVTTEVYDATTKEGRERIKSQAFKVTKTKTAIDAARKALVEGEKKRLAKIDAEGKKMWDALEALAAEVKKPATEFEDREKERIDGHEKAITTLKELGLFVNLGGAAYLPDAETVTDRLQKVQAFDATALEEFSALAATIRQDIITTLTALLAERQKAEAEAQELARLRAADEERKRQEHEAEIVRQAKEQAEAEARQREEAARQQAAEDLVRAEREKTEAVERAAQAERDRVAAVERAEQDAQRREAEAAESERKRIAAETAQQEADARKREADTEHRRRINAEALAALVAAGVPEDIGRLAVSAIARREIPHITIAY